MRRRTTSHQDRRSAGCVERAHVRCGKRFGETSDGDIGMAPRTNFHYNSRRIQKRLGYLGPDEFEVEHYVERTTTERT